MSGDGIMDMDDETQPPDSPLQVTATNLRQIMTATSFK